MNGTTYGQKRKTILHLFFDTFQAGVSAQCPIALGIVELLMLLCDKIKDRCFADYDFEEDYIDTDTGFFDDFNTESNAKSYCPDCGEPVTYEGGCVVCHSCGWSKCG